MALKDACWAAMSSMIKIASRYYMGLTTPTICTLLMATAFVTDSLSRGTFADYVRVVASIVICLLAARLPHSDQPDLYAQAVVLPWAAADGDLNLRFIVMVYVDTYVSWDTSSRQAMFKGFILANAFVNGLYPLTAEYIWPWLMPPLKALVLYQHFQFLVVIAVILLYRSYLRPGAAHGALPEGVNGIWPALALHGICIISPQFQVQRFAYFLYFLGFCGPERPGPWVLMHGSEAVRIEGLAIYTAALLVFEYHITTCHIVFLALNVIVHPLRQRLAGTGNVATTIFVAQFLGFMWFLVAHVAMLIVRQPLASMLETNSTAAGHASNTWVLWWTMISEMLGKLFRILMQRLRLRYQDRRQQRLHENEEDSTQTQQSFQHQAITKPNTIRVLQIRPSLFSRASIRCDMLEGHFTPDDEYKVYRGPDYTGVSYCWDKPSSSGGDKKTTIHIDGRPFEVQHTVYAILRAMRREFSLKHVWIDSICINQTDEREKSSQVQLMRLIYENATSTVGWLRGPSNPDPGGGFGTRWQDIKDFWWSRESPEYRAREMLGRINSTMYVHQQDGQPPGGGTGDLTTFLETMPGSPQKDWKALEGLITNPYFTRVWIIQEVVVAKHVTLWYGGQIIPWDLFARAMAVLGSKGFAWKVIVYLMRNGDGSLRPFELPGIHNGLVLENLRRWYRRPGFLSSKGSTEKMLSLEDTLKLCMRFESTWDVDRIYALLGVASDSSFLGIIPDYRQGRTKQVFTSVAVRLIAKQLVKNGNPFSVLRLAGTGHQNQKVKGLPSWVPDWTCQIQTCLLSHANREYTYHASGDTAADVKFSKEGLLCKGVVFGKITAVSDVFTADPKEGVASQFLDAYKMVLTQLGATPSRYKEAEVPGVNLEFWRTIIGDMSPDARPAAPKFLFDLIETIMGNEIMEIRAAAAAAAATSTTTTAEPDEDDDHSSESAEHKKNWRLLMQVVSNPDNTFNHMLMTDLSHANPNHKGGFTDILGAKKRPNPWLEYPLFALGRRICVTDDGYMGLVPAGTKTGDRIAVFAGAKTPHVIRSVLRHLLVGECYVHGMMDGEAVAGEEIHDWATITLI
ncbi:heterokaryon incompatibility protein-domain-containing protein [Apodospora peruviana]|uniref:Heterokaryon incompatibility protein-domain-containing protein n=1 Tax=Apodospora peruviana TaxID=516989 RepID=A0AAE0HTE1_9PEZI|nr:heterokaryon incompatibility protein-domain-containing protein [Apodospora peruviana]